MRSLSLLLILLAAPAAAQGVPTNPFASNLPSYPRPHAEPVPRIEPTPPLPPRALARRRVAACVGEASARGFEGGRRRAYMRACLAG